MIRTTLTIGDDSFLLAQEQDCNELQRRIETAITSGGGFVGFIVVGNRKVSVFMNGRERISFSQETVQFDERDTGDTAAPFGGFFDRPHHRDGFIDSI